MAEKKSTLRTVFSYLKGYRVLLGLTLLLAAAVTALTLYFPILIGQAVNCIVGPNQVDFAAIRGILVRAAVAVILTALFQWILAVCNNRITYNVVREIRKDAFDRLQILPLSYADSHSTGEIVSRVIADADTFADGLLMGFTQFFSGVLTILGTLAFMLALDWKIALIVGVLTPLSLFAAKFIAGRTHSMFLRQSETRGEQTAFIEEIVKNQKVSKAYSHEAENLADFDRINERLGKYSLNATFFSSLTNPVTRFVNSIVYAAVAFAGGISVVAGMRSGAADALTVGALTTLLAYANQYTKPFNEISGVIAELQNALACASRLFELIAQTPQIPDSPDAAVLEDAKGEFSLDGVCFSYTPERPLIRDFNLRVRPGQRVAIVGPTGCGKTTLINLLMRFYDVDAGEIRLDGGDIRGYTRRSLRKSYGMVLQETWLFSGTVRENIAMGRPDATEAEVIAAAKAAHAHGFIRRLPKGYDTVIGEDGGSLSQGQKQLLCIARIMLCMPPILILDEATSSIDTRTEQKIQDAFAELTRGRTSFIVAHRLSTIRQADVILVMRDGNVVEQGDHQSLLGAGGFYAKLWNSQFAGDSN